MVGNYRALYKKDCIIQLTLQYNSTGSLQPDSSEILGQGNRGSVSLFPVNRQKQKDNGIFWSTLHCTLWADATPATEALLVHFATVELHCQLERNLGNLAATPPSAGVCKTAYSQQ